MSTTGSPPRYVLPLDDEQATLGLVGGKGASLARLARDGSPVPDGFLVTTDAYDAVVAHHGLAPTIRRALDDADPARPDTLEAASATISAAFLAAPTPPAVRDAIRQAYTELGAEEPAVAVRSSATAEDLPEASFAGQHESFLGVRGVSGLDDAVRRCWASLWTARAIGYRARQGIDPEQVSLAVVVQRMAPAEAAGVLFTANPANGRRDEAVISAAWGLGESVVSGAVTPDSIVVDPGAGRVLRRDTAEKTVMTVRTDDGVTEQAVPADRRRSPVLDDAAAVTLARLGTDIAERAGAPQDIEWAAAGDRFAILQARPITNLPEPSADPPTDWSVPDPDAMYYRASIIEQLPDPLSPLFADLAGSAVPATLFELLDEFFPRAWQRSDFALVTVNGYAYLTIRFPPPAVRAMLVQTWSKIPLVFREAIPRWRDVARPRYQQRTQQWAVRRPDACTAAELVDGAADLVHAAAQYYTAVQAIIPLAQTEVLFGWFYDRFVRRDGDPPRQTFVLGFDSTPLRADKSLFDLAVWSRTQPALADRLAQAGAGEVDVLLETEEPPAGVDADPWTAWRDGFHAHLAAYGHTLYNLDVIHPVPADDPAPVFTLFQRYLAGQGRDPHERQRRLAAQREASTHEVSARLDPLRRVVFRALLRPAQRFVAPREDALADVGLGWPTLRRLLRELGRRLVAAGAVEQADDVFWLRLSEVRSAAAALDAGRTQLASHADAVRQRQMLWRGQRRVTPPQVLPRGARMLGIDLSPWMPGGRDEPTTDTIRGVGTSAGVATGTARVLSGPADFATLQPGEILVAAITTPAWTPLFAMASAVVTDIGGPLSHSSIVAREYEIPAVAATGVATRTIRSGQTVRVDGDAGVVTVLDGAGRPATAAQPEPAGSGDRRARRTLALVLGAVALAGAVGWRRRHG